MGQVNRDFVLCVLDVNIVHTGGLTSMLKTYQ